MPNLSWDIVTLGVICFLLLSALTSLVVPVRNRQRHQRDGRVQHIQKH